MLVIIVAEETAELGSDSEKQRIEEKERTDILAKKQQYSVYQYIRVQSSLWTSECRW